MSAEKKSAKPLIVGIIAAVVVLVVVLALLLTQCTGIFGGGSQQSGSQPTDTTAPAEAATYDLYWNLDRKLYDGLSEAGMSSRQPAEDGYFHVRFFKDGEIVELKVADRKTVNSLEPKDLMGLEFDENGIVVGVIDIEDMPLEKVGWQFYVQSTGGNIIKVNSSNSMNGMEIMLEKSDKTVGVWDMTGMSGEPGCPAEPGYLDRIYGVANEDGELTHVFIYDRSEYMRTHEAECEHCGKVVTWKEWTKTDKIPLTSGHFQLQNDVQTTGQSSMPADCKICLDLNGKRIDGASGKRVYSVHNVGAELAIMDTSEEKTGTLVAHGTGDQGLCVWVRYGAFYLYDGILDGSDAATTKNGTTVGVVKGAYFYMNGGELIGGLAKYTKNETTGKYGAGMGGTMVVAGKFVMNDGVIRDGRAQYVKYKKDGKVTYERGSAGNIFVSSTGVVEMNGGVIKNGRARVAGNIHMDGTAEWTMNGGKIQNGRLTVKGAYNGGNLFMHTKSKFTMNGGSISGGTTYNTAGNVYTNGTFTMNGGTISGGKCLDKTTGKLNAQHSSRNVYVVNGKFFMYGGRIYGGFGAVDTKADDKTRATVLVSGYAKIKGTEGAPNLSLNSYSGGDTVRLRVGKMLNGSSVGVTTAYGVFSDKCAEHNTDNFFSDIEGADIVYFDGRLALGRAACLCGSNSELPEEHIGECDGTQLFWGPWTSTSSLPNAEGNYYLINDVAATGQKSIGGPENFEPLVNLNLNGKKAVSAQRAYLVYANLNVVDHVGGGVLSGKGPTSGTDHTGTILMGGEGNVSLYSGTIGLEKDHYNLTEAGCIGIGGTAKFVMYGGTVDGSNAEGQRIKKETTTGADGQEIVTETPVTTTVKDAGAIRNTGTLIIHDGEVIGGTVTRYGGAIKCNKTSVTEIHGGTITGGVAAERAGSIYMENTATVTMKDGEIVGGSNVKSGFNGGSIYVGSGTTFDLQGGTIKDGVSVNIGGNIYANGTLKVSGGLITGGSAGGSKEANSANIACVNTQLLEITGGQIDGYVGVTDTKDDGSLIKLSGKPSINTGKLGIWLTSINGAKRPTITIEGELEDGALVGIPRTGVFSKPTVEANVDNFYANDGESIIFLDDDDCLMLGQPDMPYYHCLCGSTTEKHIGDCNGKRMLWQPWNGKSSLDTPGNYYLSGNVTDGKQVRIGNTDKPDDVYNICLNGFSITSTERICRVYGKVSFTDHTGKSVLTAQGYTNDQAGVILVGGGATFSLYGGTLKLADDHNSITSGGVLGGGFDTIINIYGGTVDGRNKDTTDTVRYGGAIRTNGILNITGGAIYGGNLSFRDNDTSVTTANGGAIYANRSSGKTNTPTVNISGGKIYGSEVLEHGGTIYMASNTALNISGGEIIGGTAGRGGAIYAAGDVTLSGDAVIRDGKTVKTSEITSSYNGGNLYISGSKASLIMTGGTIKGGNAGNASGNVYCSGAMNMSGGLITGGIVKGSATNGAANVHVVDSSFTMTGGQIDGYATVHANGGTASATLSGSAVITGGEVNLRLYCASGKEMPTVTINGKINDDFLVGVTSAKVTDPAWVFAKAGEDVTLTEDDCKHFYGDAGYSAILTADKSGMTFQSGGVRINCLCGGRLEESDVHKHEYLLWTPWSEKTSLPTEGGNYYLTEDVKLADQVNWTKEIVMNLDLNDHTITGPSIAGKRVFRLMDGKPTDNTYKLVLNITDNGTDADKEGTITAVQDGTGERGTLIWITEKTQTVSLYGGVLDASTISMTKDQGGAAVSISRGTFNIYGGTIKGGTARNGTENSNSGGAIFIADSDNGGTVNMYGGQITGGDAINAGAVALFGKNNNSVFNMQGGIIENAVAKNSGGAIFVKGGHLVLGGSAKIDNGLSEGAHGGNIYIASGLLTMDGSAEVTNGTVQSGGRYGGNIAIAGDTGHVIGGNAKVTKGENTKDSGGNIYVSGGSLTIKGEAQVDQGVAGANGGNIYVSGGTVRVEGKAQIINGDAKNTGTRRGGNVYISAGTMTLAGEAEIKDGESTSTGGNVCIGADGGFVMEGGKISGGYGQAVNHAASNVYCLGGDFTMSGGEIAGFVMIHNDAATNNATVTISGTAKITGGLTNLRFYVAGGKTPIVFNIGTMKEGAAVGVTYNPKGITDGYVMATGIKAASDATYFTSDEPTKYTFECKQTENASTYELIYRLVAASTSVEEVAIVDETVQTVTETNG